MKTRFIEKFYFNKAEYFVEDEQGNRAKLVMDYWGNSYKIEAVSGLVNEETASELNELAKDLLSRKHGKNFAEKK